MIRNGAFGSNYEMKLLMTIIALFIAYYFLRKEKNKDYFNIFIAGLVIGFIAEFATVATGTRHIVGGSLFGIDLPNWISVLLRAGAEAGGFLVFFLLITDKLLEKKTRKTGWILFTFLVVFIIFNSWMFGFSEKLVGGDVDSRRDMTTIGTMMLELGMMLFGFLWLWKTTPERRKRGIMFLVIITLLAVIWTFAQYNSNQRWIEVDNCLAGSGYIQASTGLTILAFFLDITLGSSILYLPILPIAYWLGLIRDKKT